MKVYLFPAKDFNQKPHSLIFVFALALFIYVESTCACADFVFVTGVSSEEYANQEIKNVLISASEKLEIDSGLHRVALVTGAPARSNFLDFDQFTTTKDFLNAVDKLEFKPVEDEPEARRSSRTLDEALESDSKFAMSRRRSATPIVLVLVDQGNAAFSASAATQGLFANYLKKNHYLYFYIISPKAERIKNSLILTDNEVQAITFKSNIKEALQAFVKCEPNLISKDFRRRPVSLSNSLATTPSTISLITQRTLSSDQSRLRSNLQLEQRVTANHDKISNTRNSSSITSLVKKQQQVQAQRGTHTTTTTSRLYTEKPGCQLDIVLLMDFSGGVDEKTRKTYLNLAAELIGVLNVGELAAHVAFVRYSGTGRSDTVFHLKKHRNATALIDELKKTGPLGGTTKTAAALLYAKEEFQAKYGGRPKAQKVLILFSDGYSQDDPSEAASLLKKEHIHIYTVAVHDKEVLQPDLELLKVIATDTKSVFLETQFGALKQKLGKC